MCILILTRLRLKFKLKFINGSNLSPPTFESVTVPANENEILTKKHMLLLSYQGDKGIDLTRSLKINYQISIFLITLRHKLHLLVKNLALHLMLRTEPNLNTNMMLFS